MNPNSVLAQAWVHDTDGNVRTAQYNSDTFRISIACVSGTENRPNTVNFCSDTRNLDGGLQIVFDGDHVVLLDQPTLAASQALNVEAFTSLVELLRSSSTAEVFFPDGSSESMSLRGSSRAIADCPLPAVENEQLATCEFESGFGVFRHLRLDGTGADVSLTDFCFDRESGSLSGPHIVTGLSKTVDNPPILRYENTSESGALTPTWIEIGATTYSFTMPLPEGFDDGTTQFLLGDLEADGQQRDLYGYIYSDTSPASSLRESYKVGLLVDVFGGFLSGTASFDDSFSADIFLEEEVQSGAVVHQDIQLQMSVLPDGKLQGSGRVVAVPTGPTGFMMDNFVWSSVSDVSAYGSN